MAASALLTGFDGPGWPVWAVTGGDGHAWGPGWWKEVKRTIGHGKPQDYRPGRFCTATGPRAASLSAAQGSRPELCLQMRHERPASQAKLDGELCFQANSGSLIHCDRMGQRKPPAVLRMPTIPPSNLSRRATS
jgi:hypothetical protein